MAKDLADLVVSLELQTAKYQAGFDSATKRLERFHKETSEGLKGIADLFAGALSAEAIFEFAKTTLEASASLAEFSKSAGISVEAISALQFAAKVGGVSAEELNTSLKKLNVSISDAAGNTSGKAALAFQLLGINVKNSNGSLKDANQVFNEVADKFASTADGANKVALAVALFGKAGQAMIPTLDKGSAGLKQLADDAAAAGAIIDGPTAEAAKAFTEKLNLLKTTLVDGLGAQVEKNLLPVLNALAEQFIGTTKNADGMRVMVDEVTAGFKLLITGGVLVKEIFGQIGDAIGGAVAAIGAVLEGNFTEAGKILDDQSEHAKKSAEDAAEQLTKVWESKAPAFNAAVDDTVGKAKKSLGSLSGLIAFDAAKKELQAFVDGLQGEIIKLDLGKVAATNYALSHGKLAEAMKKTGEAGKALAAEAVAAATKVETIEINKQIESLQSQLKALSGDTAGAALDNFAKSVEQLERHLKDVGGDVQANGQAVIDNLKQATVYQQAFNTLQVNAARINQDAALAEAAVNNKLQAGQITSLEAERELQKIREETISQLQGIKNGEDSIAAAANQPALTQGAKAFGGQIDALKAKTDQLTNSVRTGLESAFANNFADLITGAKSFGDAIHGLLKDVEKQFADLIAKNFAQQLFGAAGGGSAGGPLGGLSGLLSGLLSGGGGGVSGIASTGAAATGTDLNALTDSLPVFGDGGTLGAGKLGIVGDRGPEVIMGAAGGTAITPNDALGGSTHVTNNFTIQAPGGEISRASQMQTAAAVARSIAMANRRNN